jgi:glycosyltransferase involved in cell wall biosynthesis
LDHIDEDIGYNVQTYGLNAAREIAVRKKPGDLILCFYGGANKITADHHPDLKIVEPVIGYDTKGVFAPYRVFASYAHMHMFYGERGMLMTPSWNDAVIYNAISAYEFDYTEQKDDYFLYFGRVIPSKGVSLAIQSTQETGKKLIIAGPGSITQFGYEKIPDHVIEVGPCDAEQRRKLMSKARAIIGATHYVEPFGNMVVEGYMSGTPAITTDWGGFSETVIQGVTGFRCREFRDFVAAIENIDRISPANCRLWAVQNCDDLVVHQKFDHYLKRIIADNFYR